MNTEVKINEGTKGFKGVYRVTKAFLEKPEHFALDAHIRALRESGQEYLHLVARLNEMCRTEVKMYENIVPTVARQMIANNLTNALPTNLMRVKYAEVGTGITAPANTDVALQTSTYRNSIASITNASNIAYVTAFYGATETSGTFREAGIFSDGSATAGTGVLVSRVAINVTKSTSETLTIDWTLTIS